MQVVAIKVSPICAVVSHKEGDVPLVVACPVAGSLGGVALQGIHQGAGSVAAGGRHPEVGLDVAARIFSTQDTALD